MTKIPSVEERVEEFGKQFDELKMKPPKKSMPGLERELLKDFMRKALQAQREAGAREAVVKMTSFAAISRYDGERYYSVSESTIKALTPPTK